MLYSNLLTPIALYEYKLILESMLLEAGWTFDISANVRKKRITERYRDYVLTERSSVTYDAELARTAYAALAETDLNTVIAESGVTDRKHSVTILKHFILNSQKVKNSYKQPPTLQAIETLFKMYNDWVSKLYTGESVKSIMASNPKIKLCLVRAFGAVPGFNNYQLLQNAPHLIDNLHLDYLQYCRENTSIMVETENKIGHEGENYIALVGTLVSGMVFFIRKWVRNNLAEYVVRDTNRGGREETFDLLDMKYRIENDTLDINLSKILQEIASVNAYVLRNKNLRQPFYSIISWYQTVYIGDKTLTLTAMLQKFLTDKFSSIEVLAEAYSEYSFEERMDEVIYNMSKTSCLQAGAKVTSHGNVIYLPSYGVSNDTKATSPHFWEKFKEAVSSISHLYRNRDMITLFNIADESGMLNTVEKSNMVYTPGTLSNKEHDMLLGKLQKRYQLEYLPTNAAIHAFAMLLYGIHAVKDLADYLEYEGLTIMDLPTEREMMENCIGNLANVESLIISRGINEWPLKSKYSIANLFGSKQASLLTDLELAEALKTPALKMPDESIELPIGYLTSIVDTANAPEQLDDSSYKETDTNSIVKHQLSVVRKKTEQPIYAANQTGREQFIAEHRVKNIKIKDNIFAKLFDSELEKLCLQYALLITGFVDDLKILPVETDNEREMREQIELFNQRLQKIAKENKTNASLIKKVALAEKAYVNSVVNRCAPLARTLSELAMFNNRSEFCGRHGETEADYLSKYILSRADSYDKICYMLAVCLYMSQENPNSLLDPEYKKLYADITVDIISRFKECERKYSEILFALKKVDFNFFRTEHVKLLELKGAVNTLNKAAVALREVQRIFWNIGNEVLLSLNKHVIIAGCSISSDKRASSVSDCIAVVEFSTQPGIELAASTPSYDKDRTKVIDISLILRRIFEYNVVTMVRRQLSSCRDLKDESIAAVSDIQSALCVTAILNKCVGKINLLAEGYNNLLYTFQEYSVILDLKRSGKIHSEQFRKNQIPIASYSDMYQILMVRSERDVRSLQEFIQRIEAAEAILQQKRAEQLRRDFKNMGLDYILPHDNSQVEQKVCKILLEYCKGVFTQKVKANIYEMLNAIDSMKLVLNNLYKIRPVSLAQIKGNIKRFEKCKNTICRFMETDEYRIAVMGSDLDSEVLRRLRSKYAVDKATGCFYERERQQYFLANSREPASQNYADFDILVHTDGMVLIYDEANQTVHSQKIASLPASVLNAILK